MAMDNGRGSFYTPTLVSADVLSVNKPGKTCESASSPRDFRTTKMSRSGSSDAAERPAKCPRVELHLPPSEMHRAIVRNDFGHVRELLVKGDNFCTGAGDNCYLLAAHLYTMTEKVDMRLETILELDPRGINAKSTDGDTVLMFCCDDLAKVERLVQLGADVNAEDNFGGTVLMKCYHSMTYKFDILMKLISSGADVSKGGFLDYLVSCVLSPEYREGRELAILIQLFRRSLLSEKALLSMKVHPMKLLCLLSRDLGLVTCKVALKNLHKSGFVGKRAPPLITAEFIHPKEFNFVWLGKDHSITIPQNEAFDIMAYFLYKLDLVNATKASLNAAYNCFCILLEDFKPSDAEGVVHPIRALLYNIFSSYRRVHTSVRFWCKRMAQFLYNCLLKFQDFPFARHSGSLAVGDSGGQLDLDLLMLMTPLLGTPNEYSFQCAMAFMQLCPMHPFRLLNAISQYTAAYPSSECVFTNYSIKFAPVLAERIAQSCQDLTFEGMDQETRNDISRLSGELCEFRGKIPSYKGKLCSLKRLSIQVIRNTLYLRRRKTSTTLPSLIRRLFSEGRLPKNLESSLLVYKNNKTLNF